MRLHTTKWQQLKNDAWLAKQRGNFADAETLLFAALDEVSTNPLLREKMCLTLNILANLYVENGEFAEAIKIAKYDVQLLRELPNEKEMLLGSGLLTLAGILTVAGQYAEVIPFAEEGVKIYAKVLGENHSETDRMRNLLSEAKRNLVESPALPIPNSPGLPLTNKPVKSGRWVFVNCSSPEFPTGPDKLITQSPIARKD